MARIGKSSKNLKENHLNMQDPAYNLSKTAGEQLRDLRKEKSMTQAQAAKLCGVGLRTYIEWENGANSKPLTAFDTLRAAQGE